MPLRIAKLTDGDLLFVVRLLADAPRLADTVVVAERLHRTQRKEEGQPLPDVLAAPADTLLAGFVVCLRLDKDAVRAALDLS